jgi:hypothetical protein
MTGWRSLLLRRETGIALMIVLFCLAVGAVKPQFLTLNSLRIILLLTPLILIGAMGQMLVIVSRHVDLSIGSMMGLTAMVAGMMFRYLPEVVIEHLHVGLAKAQGDALYEEIIRRPFDHRRYAELAPERREQAERLLAAAGLRREVDVSELERRRADARNPPGGNWFVWP